MEKQIQKVIELGYKIEITEGMARIYNDNESSRVYSKDTLHALKCVLDDFFKRKNITV